MDGQRNESPRCARKSNGLDAPRYVSRWNGKVKSRRAQKRKGDAGVGDGKQRWRIEKPGYAKDRNGSALF